MKKVLLIFASIVLLSATPLQKFDSKGFREFVQLEDGMEVFYLLYGKYDGIKQKAYLHITKDYISKKSQVSRFQSEIVRMRLRGDW